MKITRILILLSVMLSFSYCKKDPNRLSVINSNSFHEKQVELHFQIPPAMEQDSLVEENARQQQSSTIQRLDELISLKERVMESPDNKLWKDMKQQWHEFYEQTVGDSLSLMDEKYPVKGKLSGENAVKWAQLNIDLLRFSGEAPFGDALELLLYRNRGFQFPDSLLKTIIYTHVFDDIYINIIGSSSMEYQHTTGGTVKLIQDTNYPGGSEMILKIETSDARLLNIFIRIPTWAVNPKVSYGNIKYVAHPGQYTEVSKKWNRGDEITVSLNN